MWDWIGTGHQKPNISCQNRAFYFDGRPTDRVKSSASSRRLRRPPPSIRRNWLHRRASIPPSVSMIPSSLGESMEKAHVCTFVSPLGTCRRGGFALGVAVPPKSQKSGHSWPKPSSKNPALDSAHLHPNTSPRAAPRRHRPTVSSPSVTRPTRPARAGLERPRFSPGGSTCTTRTRICEVQPIVDPQKIDINQGPT